MTLIEVMLAIGIATGVMGGAMAFYQHALKVREGVLESIRAVEANRRVMDLMTKELRAATVHNFTKTGLEGQADEIAFVTTSLPGAEAWILGEREDRAVIPSHDLTIVGYCLRYSEDPETGQTLIDGLERTLQKVLTLPVTDEELDIESTLVSPYVAFVNLRYFHQGAWLDSWTGGDVPMAVEITLGVEPLAEGLEPDEYDSDSLKRVVFIPSAVRGAR